MMRDMDDTNDSNDTNDSDPEARLFDPEMLAEELREMVADIDPEMLGDEQLETLANQVAVGMGLVADLYSNACGVFMQAHAEDLIGSAPTDPMVLGHRTRAVEQAVRTGVAHLKLTKYLASCTNREWEKDRSGKEHDTVLQVDSASELVLIHIALHAFLTNGLEDSRSVEVSALAAMYQAPSAGE